MNDKTASELAFAAWIDSDEPAAMLARGLIECSPHNREQTRSVIEFVYRSAYISGSERVALKLGQQFEDSIASAFGEQH